MCSPDPPRAGRGLVGVVEFGRFDADRIRTDVRYSLGVSEREPVLSRPLALASAGGHVYRQGDLLCAIEGRLANRESLAERFGCRALAPPAEVAAAAYSRLGERAVEAFRGEFVVVLWDASTRSGLLARDQLGGRTVFVHTGGSRLAFACDVKWLLRLIPSRPGVDDQGLVEWLLLGGTLGGRTLYAGIRRLDPGSMLRIHRDGWSERSYWRPRYTAPLEITRDDAAAELRGALENTVSSQIEGADAVGVLLSGGLDSGTVAAAARDVISKRDGDLVAYSMTFPDDPSVDESRLIRDVSDRLAIPSVQMQVFGGSMLRGGLDFLRAWQLPSAVPNMPFTAELQRHAVREGTDVMLDGEGGDELFGAEMFLPASYLRRGNLRGALRICRRVPGVGGQPGLRQVISAFRMLAIRGAIPYRLQRMRRSLRRPEELVPEWLAGPSARVFAISSDPWAWKRAAGPLWWAHLSHTLSKGREELWMFDYLRQIGAMSDLERRHPLLDLELVGLLLRLPPEYSFDPRFDRALVRRAMADRLPAAVSTRADKSYFTPLLRQSLLRNDLPLVRRLLESPKAEIRRFVDPPALSGLLDAASSAEEPAAFVLQAWRLVMAECWLRSQVDDEFAEKLLHSAAVAAPRIEFSTRSPRPNRLATAA